MSAVDDGLTAARARVVALTGELDRTRRELWIERARRTHPALPEGFVEFLTAPDEVGIAAQAARLVAHLR